MTLDYFYGQSGELFSYFRIPKALFQDCRFRQLSTDARTLYGILLDRMSLSVKNGWLDEQGRVYIIYTVREVQESLCCAEHKAVKLFRELEDIDLIERKRRGLGRPSLIYVKDFSSGLPKAQVQNCPNSNSGAAESAILEQPKPQANKTDKNKTEMNKPDPIHSGNMGLLEVPENLINYFDFEAYGRDMRLNEGGHFAPGGYLTRVSNNFVELYHGIEDIPPEHRVFAYPQLSIREQMAAYKEIIDGSARDTAKHRIIPGHEER